MSYLSGDYANNDIPLNGEDSNSTIYSGNNIYTGNNTFSGSNTFSSTINTNGINNSNSNNIVTTYGNVALQNLGNSYLANNVYTNGYFLPYFNLSTTSYRMGLYAMRYQEATSTENICIGTNACAGTSNTTPPRNNSIQKTIAIGNGAFESPTYGTYGTVTTDNVIIGNNSCKGANIANSYNVVIGSETCSSGNAGGNARSVVIGYGIGRTRGYYTDSVIIGANNLINNGANSCAIVGGGNLSNAVLGGGYANGCYILGVNNLVNATLFNSVIAIGDTVFTNMNSPVTSIGIGRYCAEGLTSGYFNIFMGQSLTCQGATTNTVAIGHGSAVNSGDNNTFLIGGNDGSLQGLGYTRYQDLCIRNKNRVLCGYLNTAATVNLTFELPEHYIITSATTTTINLPTPAIYNQNLGTRFTIVRAALTATITINAPSGQYIRFNGLNSSSYLFSSAESYVTFVCCDNGTGNATWAVMNSQQITTGGFPTGVNVNSIYPYYVSSQCDLWPNSTASIINIGNQTTPQIINFSKINTNTIEPKEVATNINLFTTTIASVLNLGNSGNISNANFYLNPTIAGTSIHTLTSTFNGGITATASQTINFGTNSPYMRGDNIVANSIGQTQIDSGYLDLFTNQTIPFGVKTFTNPPVLSGASITATSIPNSALQTTVTLNNTASTFSALKTFSVAPSNAAQTISATGVQTFSITGGREVILANSGITQITLPVVASGNVGQTFQILKSVAFTATVNIVPQAGSTIFANNASATNIYMAITCNAFTITATSTTNWVMYNNDNPEMTIQSKNIYPLSGKMDLAPLPNLGAVSTISIGNGALAACPTGYRTSYSVAIGSGCLAALTGNAQGMVCIGNNCMLSSTSNLIQNTTAIGSGSGAAYAITGGSNTLIGAATDFISGGTYNYSTALGYGAIITSSNQVILGRTSETVIMPSAKVQYGTYQPHSVYQTINATSLNWDTSPPTPLSKTVLFSCSSTTIVTLTLPAISNAAIFEGFEFQFRRTNTFASATTTSQLIALCSGTDTIYIPGAMTTAASIFALASGAFYSRLVCVNKTTTPYNWAYFP